MTTPSGCRVMFVAYACYFDTSNGASVATRSLMECLARRGFLTSAVTGTVLERGEDVDPGAWLIEQGLTFSQLVRRSGSAIVTELVADAATHYRLTVNDVPVLLHRSPATRPHEVNAAESREFLELLEDGLDEFRPNVILTFGGDVLSDKIRDRARARGAAIVFALHNFNYRNRTTFECADAVIVPSRFAVGYYRKALGLECRHLPYLVDFGRSHVEARIPRYVTYVNPSHEKGVYAFARIADELGRQRPDIPLLVVEGRGTERTLVDCGLDLRLHGNVHLMSHTPDPRQFWEATRICVMPSLWWENQPLVAIEAMLNGIPVIGSDRGGVPETLGDGGIVLGIPPRLTRYTRELPTAEEVAPWVRAIACLWDDPDWYAELSRRATAESRRWCPEMLEPQYVDFFLGVHPSAEGPRSRAAAQLSLSEAAPSMTSRGNLGAFLNDLCLQGAGAEVGVQSGHFSRQILDQWRGKLLYMIDIWQPIDGYRDVTNAPVADQVERLVHAIRRVTPHWPRVRILQELSENAARMIPDGSLDWVYIDANHDYASVAADLHLWTPKVRPGGLVAGHDFLDEVRLIGGVETVFGVRRAVTEHFGGQEIETTNEDFPTWYVIKIY